jgi:hypothetical protein
MAIFLPPVDQGHAQPVAFRTIAGPVAANLLACYYPSDTLSSPWGDFDPFR